MFIYKLMRSYVPNVAGFKRRRLCVKRLKVIIVGIFVMMPIIGLAGEPSIQKKIDNRLEMIKATEDIIEFYGRVVDQYDRPIEGALIVLSVGQATLLPKSPLKLRVTSDQNGEFGIGGKSIKGGMLFIKSIERDGYEFHFSQSEKRGFDYRKDNPHRFLPDKTHPVVFHMRKKEFPPTFLFRETGLEFQVSIAESDKTIGYDFIQRDKIRDVANPVGDDKTRVCDLQVRATFNMSNATWAVVLSPGNITGGIIVSEQLLYEAPEIGYQSEYTLTPQDQKPLKAKYIYLKSRNPAIYTRYEIEYINANKEFFRLSGKSVTNPYGNRNLEQATNLPWAVTKQLTDEVETAFRQGKRPPTPDLQKLIKDASNK